MDISNPRSRQHETTTLARSRAYRKIRTKNLSIEPNRANRLCAVLCFCGVGDDLCVRRRRVRVHTFTTNTHSLTHSHTYTSSAAVAVSSHRGIYSVYIQPRREVNDRSDQHACVFPKHTRFIHKQNHFEIERASTISLLTQNALLARSFVCREVENGVLCTARQQTSAHTKCTASVCVFRCMDIGWMNRF